MKFQKIEELEKDVVLYPFVEVHDSCFGVCVKDSEGDEQVLLSVYNNGTFKTVALDEAIAKKWGIQVDNSGNIKRS